MRREARRIRPRRGLRIRTKLILAAIPAFVLGMLILFRIVTGQVTCELEDWAYDSLLEHAEEVGSRIDSAYLGQLNWKRPLNDAYYQSLRLDLNTRSKEYEISWMDSVRGTRETIPYFTNFWLYRVEGEHIYTAICGTHPVNLEIEAIYEGPRNQAMIDVLAYGQVTRGKILGSFDDEQWLIVLKPLFDGDRLVAILETSRPVTEVTVYVKRFAAHILLCTGAVMGAVTLAYMVVLGVSLRALNELKRGAQAIAGGTLSARVIVHTTDETAEIAQAFNAMASSVEESIGNISAISEGYSRFVPTKMLSILDKPSIKDVKQGDFSEVPATCLLLTTNSFDGLDDREFFSALNRFYGLVLPHIGKGGVIERYSERQLTALYDGEPERALDAVIHTFAALDRAAREENRPTAVCSVMLMASRAVLGVIGDGNRLSMIVPSRLSYGAENIGALGREYGCRLLLTGSAYDALGGAVARYRHRFVGYLSIGGTRQSIYDFFDCEPPVLMRAKGETRECFEQAVECYCAGDYASAYRLFIDVIKRSPLDFAAREYLKKSYERLDSGLPPDLLLEL